MSDRDLVGACASLTVWRWLRLFVRLGPLACLLACLALPASGAAEPSPQEVDDATFEPEKEREASPLVEVPAPPVVRTRLTATSAALDRVVHPSAPFDDRHHGVQWARGPPA